MCGTRRASGASGGPVRAVVARRAPSAEACAVSGAGSSSLSRRLVLLGSSGAPAEASKPVRMVTATFC